MGCWLAVEVSEVQKRLFFARQKDGLFVFCTGMKFSGEAKLSVVGVAGRRSELEVQVVGAEDRAGFDQQLAEQHYLGAGRAVGDYLRQVVRVRGRAVALLAWGPACYALKARDQWVGWNATQRVERLKLIVQNRRFLLLADKGEAPNLASQSLTAAVRALAQQWRQVFGYRPLLAESFTDPTSYPGTCYKASNWESVGLSAGYRRERARFYVANESPKRLWLHLLDPGAREHLRAGAVPVDCQAGVIAAPSGVLPLTQPQMLALYELLQCAPDPRGKNTRWRIGAVLTLLVMALWAGRCEIASIARFATTLHPRQRRLLGLPRTAGTKAFYGVPPYGVFSAVLTRLDVEGLVGRLEPWLQIHASGTAALAGEMIRHHLGRLTRVGSAVAPAPGPALA